MQQQRQRRAIPRRSIKKNIYEKSASTPLTREVMSRARGRESIFVRRRVKPGNMLAMRTKNCYWKIIRVKKRHSPTTTSSILLHNPYIKANAKKWTGRKICSVFKVVIQRQNADFRAACLINGHVMCAWAEKWKSSFAVLYTGKFYYIYWMKPHCRD